MPFAQSRKDPSRKAQRGVASRIASSLVLISLVPLPATPESRHGGSGPDAVELLAYLECSAAAEVRMLGFDEAAFCSTVFLKIKLAFVPDVDLEKYNTLPSLEKTAVDQLGYLRYLDWKDRNAAEIEALMTEIRASETER